MIFHQGNYKLFIEGVLMRNFPFLIILLIFVSCNTSPSIDSKLNSVSLYGDLQNSTLTAKFDNKNSLSIYRKYNVNVM